ncbi:MAG TPA: CBS domain-containing protein [Hyphomicrobiaceae bacterium]|nr:CBS domain-containing protein [Hyphomicrobiaceae bacterium]
MTTINQLLTVKGHDYFSVGPEQTVYAAIKLMADRDVGSLLVMEGGVLAGIVTERHYARDVMLKGRTSPQTLVREIMETEVACVEPDKTVEACLELMTRERVRHLPVVDGGRVVGIVSIGDLVKNIIEDQRFTIDQLENYIHGETASH